MSDSAWAAFWPAFWPALALVIGAVGSEIRNSLAQRAAATRQTRADAVAELSTLVQTLKQEACDRDKRHGADMDELRKSLTDSKAAHADCTKQYQDLAGQYEKLKVAHGELAEDHESMKRSMAALQQSVAQIRSNGESK